jgi:ribosomal protein S12 methylthiotransferase accessory factor
MLNLFADAASLLLGAELDGATQAACLRLLEALDYVPAARTGKEFGEIDAELLHRARLLQAAAHFLRIFELQAPDAPGLFGFGAEFDPALADPRHAGGPVVGVSGVGLTLQQAFQACVGEGVEYLSQLESSVDEVRASPMPELGSHDPATRRSLIALLSSCGASIADISWRPATRLIDHATTILPTDLCLRRPFSRRDFAPPFPLSVGSAAGTSWDAAAVHGLLELIERDAAALWWRGGLRGRPVDPDTQVEADALLCQLRSTASAPRRSWLLDITTNIGIPVVAALSSRPDGFGLAFGLAARPTAKAAARSALVEMCQIELADAVVESKRRERGDSALNPVDRAHLQRATTINADECRLMHPLPERAEHLAFDAGDPSSLLRLMVLRLRELGIETYALNLTRPRFAIPVARIVAPGLQIEPSGFVTARLSEMIAHTGGGAIHTGGAGLI